MGFQRMVDEDEGLRHARALMNEMYNSPLHLDGHRETVRKIHGDICNSGRSKKALERVRKRAMQHEGVKQVRLQAGRKHLIVSITYIYVANSDRGDFEERSIHRDLVTLKSKKFGERTVTVGAQILTEHALARLIGRNTDYDNLFTETIDCMDEAFVSMGNYSLDHHYKKAPWTKFPIPFRDGLLICQSHAGSSAEFYRSGFTAVTFLDGDLLRPDQIAMRDHIIDEGWDALWSYPDEAVQIPAALR